jgi:hypothetical protein
MKLISATEPYRKSGEVEGSAVLSTGLGFGSKPQEGERSRGTCNATLL